jgi:hypothetical protein
VDPQTEKKTEKEEALIEVISGYDTPKKVITIIIVF